MREIVAWAIPLLVSFFLIQTAADLLSMRAATVHSKAGAAGTVKQGTRGPVHEVDLERTAGGIVT